MESLFKAASLAAVLAAIGAAPGAAQALDEDDLAERFRAQRDIIEAVSENPELGKSRGLVLTPIDGPAEAPAGAGLEREPDAALAIASEATHVGLPADEQVNVRITFAFDSAVLAEDQKPKLRTVCGALEKAGVGLVRIVGHTDASGSERYNQTLSVLRAEEVQRFFVDECGIPADRTQAVGVGEQFPYDDRDPTAAVNRRVEFQALS